MHRATPAHVAFRSYSAGGARTAITSVDDSKLMQQTGANFMKGESRKNIESPQNYGFTSVNMPPTMGSDGQMTDSAESIVYFIGGSRSLPIMGPTDDRRYRLYNLKPGDVGVFDHLQHQMHFNNDGIFITGRTDKKMKFQLADPPQQQQSGGGGGTAAGQLDAAGGSSGGSGGQQTKGQKQRYDQSGEQYLEMNKDTTNLVHDKTINYKTGTHNFQSSQSSGTATTTAAGGPLVQIFGDKFTAGLGYFMKQVTAAPPTSPMHLATKGYIDSIFSALKITIPPLPPLPIPPLPPGVTLPPGITLPTQEEASVPMPTSELEARLSALERRVAELERRAI